jgi:hypothetical protein
MPQPGYLSGLGIYAGLTVTIKALSPTASRKRDQPSTPIRLCGKNSPLLLPLGELSNTQTREYQTWNAV